MTPWTAAHQAPPSMGCSRREYWSGVPLPSPTCTLAGVKHTASGNVLCNTGSSVMASRGGRGREGGRPRREGVYLHFQLIHAVASRKQTQHCKTIVFRLKIKLEKNMSILSPISWSISSLLFSPLTSHPLRVFLEVFHPLPPNFVV